MDGKSALPLVTAAFSAHGVDPNAIINNAPPVSRTNSLC